MKSIQSEPSLHNLPYEAHYTTHLPHHDLRQVSPIEPSRSAPSTWHSPNPDPSIPTTPMQQQFYVFHLINAITSMNAIHDRPTPSLLRRWSPSTTPPYYSLSVLEALAWCILDFTHTLHTQGSSAFSSHDPSFLSHAAKTAEWTFAQRMGKVCEVLRCSKSRCEKLLKGLHVQFVVGNPERVLRLMRGNVVQNGRRQRVLEAGRRAKKARRGDGLQG